MTLIEKTVSELAALAHESDLGILTRRLMDASNDFYFTNSLLDKIIALRRDYNEWVEGDKDQSFTKESIEQTSRQLLDLALAEAVQNKNEEAKLGQSILKAQDLGKSYKTKQKKPFKLEPLDIDLKLGSVTSVVGENGNGKTTLLSMLAGQLASTSGSITFGYPQVGAINDWYSHKQHIGYISQRLNRWFGTLIDNLRFTAASAGIVGEENERRVEFIIQRLGLHKFRDLTWTQISGGYRLRFELARVLIRRPQVLVLDEPLANLDINAQQLFLQDLKFMSASLRHPFAIIISSQQLHEIEHISDDILFLKKGEAIYNGSREEFGNARTNNSIELSGDFGREALKEALASYSNITIEDYGTVFIISLPIGHEPTQLLAELLAQKIPVKYYRDISNSTRKLFRKDM
jgi:ABC-2 type transport system ATP-binding protein